jgi:hypothetical protein
MGAAFEVRASVSFAIYHLLTLLTEHSKNRKTVTFSVNDFFRVRATMIAKIHKIFTHTRVDECRLFAVVELANGDFESGGIIEKAEDVNEDMDPILRAPIFQLTGSRVIVGLPSIIPQQIWVVPARAAGEF